MSEAVVVRNSRMPSPTLREVAGILFRQSRAAVTSFVLVLIAVMLYAWFSPRYEAHFKVLLRRGRSDPVVSPQPPNLADFTRPTIGEEELNSEVELLRDESLLRQVAEQSGLMPSTAGPADQERAVRKLKSGLKVEPLRRSNLIRVYYRAADADRTVRVLAALSDAYVQKHVVLRRPSGELQFFEQQTADYEKKLQESEAELVRFAKERGVSAPALERDIALQKLGEAEAVYRQLDQQRADAQRRATALREQLKSFPSRSVTLKRWADNPLLLEKLKSQLLELQLKRTELLTRYEPSYRLVQEVDQQMEQTRQSITAEGLTPVRDETSDKDPNYEWARLELEKTEVEAQSVHARLARSLSQIELLRSVALRMEADSVTQQRLVRDVKVAEQDYLLYRQKREEARIGDALDERRILNVALVEPPITPALPLRPLLFWFFIAMCAATAAAICAAFVAEYFDATIRTPDEAYAAFKVPVLAWLPAAPKPLTPILVPKFRQKEAVQ